MNPLSDSAPCFTSQLTDIVGLRASSIFPTGREPSIRTLREWEKLRGERDAGGLRINPAKLKPAPSKTCLQTGMVSALNHCRQERNRSKPTSPLATKPAAMGKSGLEKYGYRLQPRRKPLG